MLSIICFTLLQFYVYDPFHVRRRHTSAFGISYYSEGKGENVMFSFKPTATAAAKSLQSCLTLCDPIDSSPPGSAVPGILQARTLEWVAISFSNAWKRKVKVKSLSCVQLLATPWTAAHQAPPSMGFSRQEYWNGVPLPSPLQNCLFASSANKITLKICSQWDSTVRKFQTILHFII